MAQNEALVNDLYTNRRRVRTPGKFVFYFLFLPVAICALAVGIWLNQRTGNVAPNIEYRVTQTGVEKAYYALPEILVDLAPDLNGRTAYLKMKITVALEQDSPMSAAQSLNEVKPDVMERINFFLRILRPEDFDGSEGMQRIKSELKKRINLAIAPQSVSEVVVEEIIIQ